MTKPLLQVFIVVTLVLMVRCAHTQRLPTLGMATSLENDSLLYASGFRLIGTTVSELLSPSIPEKEFSQKLEQVKTLQCSVIMCNVLFPPSLKIAGPDVNEADVLAYLHQVSGRAKQMGVRNLILGSGGARRLPDGYDKMAAMRQFAELAKKMAKVVSQYNVTLILENLNSTETNFINTLKDAAWIVRTVNHPNFRLNADIYHMMKENESAAEMIDAGKLIAYCEIAEKTNRTLPGVMGDDFLPYFQALKKIKYTGPILIEGRSENIAEDVPKAFQYLTTMLKEAYNQKSSNK